MSRQQWAPVALGRSCHAVAIASFGESFASKYKSIAHDSTQSAERQKAATLFVVAEDCLSAGGVPEDATRSAKEALAAARDAGDADLLADAVRLVVKANCFRARGGVAANVRQIALGRTERLAETEAAMFRQQSDLHGEAVMKLCLAEVNLEKCLLQERQAALRLAVEARGRFQRLGDRKMEAAALVVMARVHLALGHARQAEEQARASLDSFRYLRDRLGEALALHLVSSALAAGGPHAMYEESARFAAESAAAYQSLGLFRSQAIELMMLAEINLQHDESAQAVDVAREALRVLRESHCAARLEGHALGILVRAHLEQEDVDAAQQAASEGLTHFREIGDRYGTILSQDALAHTLLSQGNAEEALKEALAALDMCEEDQDAQAEAQVLLTIAQVEVQLQHYDEAMCAAEDAAAALEKRAAAPQVKVATVHYAMARILNHIGHGKDAAKAASRSRAAFVDDGDLSCEAQCLVLIASSLCTAREFDDAAETALLAQERFREVDDARGEGQALEVLTQVHRCKDNIAKALDIGRQRRMVLQQAGWRRDEAKALDSMVTLLLASGEAKEAGRAARDGLRLARATGDRSLEIKLLCRSVQVHLQIVAEGGGPVKASRNLLEETARLARDAVAMSQNVYGGQHKAHAAVWHSQAVWMTNQQDALSIAKEAVDLYRTSRDLDGEASASLLAAEMAVTMGDNETAELFSSFAVKIFKETGYAEGMLEAQKVLDKISRPKNIADLSGAFAVEAAPEDTIQALAVPQTAPDRQQVHANIMAIVQEAISDDGLTDDAALLESGLDSLSVVSFRNTLQTKFSISLEPAVLFEYPTIAKLTDHVFDSLNTAFAAGR